MRRFLPTSLAFATLLGMALRAQSPTPPPQIRAATPVDSGYLHNPASSAQVVFRDTLRFSDTAWLQLHFGEGLSLPPGSFLRITALADGAEQRHDGLSVAAWGGHSAAFNGDAVRLELVAGPGTRGNRLVVHEATLGLPIQGPETICGPTDDRGLSSDPRQGRLFSGCTGWMISTDLMLTAGHCVGSATRILEFNVPLSSSNGSVRRAHPDDQYPFTVLQSLNAGVGSDWAVNRVGRNSNHGQLPTDRNGGQWYTLGAVPGSAAGNGIRITGYGTTGSPVSPTWNQVQKTHLGSLSQVAATSLCYATDTTGGNSGSPVIHENTGHAIGVHTHGGCSSTGGCNRGTRIDRSDLQAAILAAGRTPGTFVGFGSGCTGTGRTPPTCASLNGQGGTLTNAVATNEYAYTSATAIPISVTGFRIFSASTTGSAATVGAAIYSDNGGLPAATPLAQTTVTIGAVPGFYLAAFASPVAIPPGRYYLAVDHSQQTTYLANLSAGTSGQTYWRRPPLSGSWALSGLIGTPSFQVECSGGGTPGAVPTIAGAGTPETGSAYESTLSRARPNAVGALLTGFTNQSWGGNPLPFSLAGLGAPGCDLLVAPEIADTVAVDGNGEGRRSIQVPRNPALVGARLYHQWAVIDAGANQLGLAVSGGLEVRVGG
jgi:V8-like Glu-specific endopeptidase